MIMSSTMDQIYAALRKAGHGLTTTEMAEATGLPLEEIEQALTEALTGGGDNAFWQYDIGQDLGSCNLCGWKDGKGVYICHNNLIHGPLYHYNSPAKFRSTLNPSQLSLQESHESEIGWRWKEADIDRMRMGLLPVVAGDETLWYIGDSHFLKSNFPTPELAVEAYLIGFRLNDVLEQGWTIRKITNFTWGEDTPLPGFSSEAYFLQKPHECGGFAYSVKEGTVLVCTGCDCQIVYEDHGIRSEDHYGC